MQNDLAIGTARANAVIGSASQTEESGKKDASAVLQIFDCSVYGNAIAGEWTL